MGRMSRLKSTRSSAGFFEAAAAESRVTSPAVTRLLKNKQKRKRPFTSLLPRGIRLRFRKSQTRLTILLNFRISPLAAASLGLTLNLAKIFQRVSLGPRPGRRLMDTGVRGSDSLVGRVCNSKKLSKLVARGSKRPAAVAVENKPETVRRSGTPVARIRPAAACRVGAKPGTYCPRMS